MCTDHGVGCSPRRFVHRTSSRPSRIATSAGHHRATSTDRPTDSICSGRTSSIDGAERPVPSCTTLVLSATNANVEFLSKYSQLNRRCRRRDGRLVASGRSRDRSRSRGLSRHDRTCPISGVDHPGLLDVAHALSWSTHPEYRADLSNVLALRKTHHTAFDRELFTIDQDCQLCVSPSFETWRDLLRRTIIDRAGEWISIPVEVEPAVCCAARRGT